nr:hypothetical protein [Tanacetum cinerariifolium]
MKMVGKGFSGRDTPLFLTMMVQVQEALSEDIEIPTETHPTPIIIQPSTSKPQKKQKPRRQDIEEIQPSDPIINVAGQDLPEDTVPTHSNNTPLSRVNTLESEEDRLKLKELMKLCTKLSDRVLNLETTKTAQAKEIANLKKRVKMLERKRKSITHGLKRLYKVGLSAKVESSAGEEKDSSIQRRISDIDANQDIYLVNVHRDEDIFGVNDQDDNSMFDADKDLQGEEVVVEEDDVQAKIEADYEIAQRLQAEEQEQLTDAEKAKLFMKFLEKKRKFFAAKRAEEKRNKPPTKAQQRILMSTYLKNMDGWKTRALKNKSFTEIKDLFDKAMARINNFFDFKTKLVEESTHKDEAVAVHESILKIARNELEQERSKKHKIDDENESVELKRCLEIVPNDGDKVTIDDIPLFVKTLIVDYKIYKEGRKSFFQIFKADVKDRFVKTKPVDDMDNFLLHTLKTMFEHHVEDTVWKSQQGLTKVKS